MSNKITVQKFNAAVEKGKAQGMTEDEVRQTLVEADYELPFEVKEKGFLAGAAEKVGQVLNATGGVGRAPLAIMHDTFEFNPKKKMNVNLSEVLSGRVSDSDSLLERAGVPKGSQFSEMAPALYSTETDPGITMNPLEMLKWRKGGMMDGTPRGFLGGVMDVFSDPATWITGGTKAALDKTAKAAAQKITEKAAGNAVTRNLAKPLAYGVENLPFLVDPVSQTLEATGSKLYKSGLRKIDREAKEYGKAPVSDILMDNGVWGSTSSIHEGMDSLADDILKKRDAMEARADRGKNAAEVSMNDAMAAPERRIKTIRDPLLGNPALLPLADDLEQTVNMYKSRQAYPEGKMEPVTLYAGTQTADPRIGSVYIPQHTQTREVKSSLPVGSKVVDPEAIPTKVQSPFSDVWFAEVDQGMPVGINTADPEIGGKLKNDTLSPMNLAAGKKIHVPAPMLPFTEVVTVPGKTREHVFTDKAFKWDKEKKVGKLEATPDPLVIPGPEEHIRFTETEEFPGELIKAPDIVTEAPGERIYGPSAQQGSAWKTTMGLDSKKYQDGKSFGAMVEAEKEMQTGMRRATEDAVGRSLGEEAKIDYIKLNDELGRILTTKERQKILARAEVNKDAITQVDASLAAAAPYIFAAKQGAKAANSSAFKTGAGLLLNKTGKAEFGKLSPEAVWKQLLLKGVIPGEEY